MTQMETFDRHGRHRWTGTGGRSSPSPQSSGGYGKRRRRRLGLKGALVLLAIIALAAGGAYWWWIQPAALAVTAWPEDALITFEGVDYIGDCALEELEPGAYRLVVSRDGFEPYETTVELARLRTAEYAPRLTPLPQEITVASNPSGASYRIETSEGEALVGQTPFTGQVPAGPTAVTLSAPGFNEYLREMMVDSTTLVSLWMDPEGQVVHCLGVWDCGPAPKGAVFNPDGSEIWVSLLAGPPSVQVFDAETFELLDELVLGDDGAVEVVFSEDGEHAYASQMETARVYEIDAATRTVTRTFDTESSWSKMIEIHDGRMFVSNWTGDDVSEIDIETGETTRRLMTVDTPRGLYVTEDGTDLYVAGFGGGIIEKIGLEDGVHRTVYDDGVAARHFAADPEGGKLYCTDMGTDEVLVLDLATDGVERFVETDEKPNTIDISPDGRVLFVSCRGANNATSYYLPGPEWGSILLFDTATGEPLDAIIAGNQPTALAVSDDGTRLVFSDFLDDRLRLYEIPDYETLIAGEGGLFDSRVEMMQK